MTYWKQFAEMLGLELEQEFNLTDECNEIGGCSCFIGDEKEDIEETND